MNSSQPPIHGFCDPKFQQVKKTFVENFTLRGDVGAAVCIYQNGQKLVDLWGGYVAPLHASAASVPEWQEDTILCMMSVGKFIPALCLMMAEERGLLSLDDKVSAHWPAFAQAGKENITIDDVISGLAGLIYADHAPKDSLFDLDQMATALEQQAPEWPVGTQGAYHSSTLGALLMTIFKKATGEDFIDFYHREVAGPLGLDYSYGVAEQDRSRLAPLIPNPNSTTLQEIANPQSKIGRAWRPVTFHPGLFQSDAFFNSIFPSANGHGTVRSIARLFAALASGGIVDGIKLVKPQTIEKIRQERWFGPCGLTDREFRYGRGCFLNHGDLAPLGANEKAFGHMGGGGAIGFADPENKLSFAFASNLMCGGAGVGDRCKALINAAYE